MDTAGRIVVPKALREMLKFKPGQPLEVRAVDGRLEIQPAAAEMILRDEGTGLVAVPAEKLPVLTAEEVRSALEGVRR